MSTPTTKNSNSRSNPQALARVAGVWQREWEEDPLGDTAGADRDTLVLWTQSSQCGIYVDLRLPLDSPGRSLKAARALGVKPYPPALAAATTTTTIAPPPAGSSSGTTPWERLTTARGKTMSDEDLWNTLSKQKSFAGVLHAQPGDTTGSGDALQKDPILAQLAAANDNDDNKNAAIPLCTCFWRRDLDYQPPSGGLDIGVCCAAAPGAAESAPTNNSSNPHDDDDDAAVAAPPPPLLRLRETGDDGSYAEGWWRLPGSEQGPFLALKLLSETNSNNNTSNQTDTSTTTSSTQPQQQQQRAGYWVRAGSRFAYAVGRPTTADAARELACPATAARVKDCVGQNLDEALQSLIAKEADGDNDTGGSSSSSNSSLGSLVDIALSYVAVAGEIVGDDDNDEQWKILHSTNPELVGCLLVHGGHDVVQKQTLNVFCCSRLFLQRRTATTTDTKNQADAAVSTTDTIVEQIIPLSLLQEGRDGGGGEVTRLWQVVEQVNCDLPV